MPTFLLFCCLAKIQYLMLHQTFINGPQNPAELMMKQLPSNWALIDLSLATSYVSKEIGCSWNWLTVNKRRTKTAWLDGLVCILNWFFFITSFFIWDHTLLNCTTITKVKLGFDMQIGGLESTYLQVQATGQIDT